MKNSEINIRDPFVMNINGMYYLYGTRANNFGISTGGFDVYKSRDLENWSYPKQIFDSARFGLNKGANWAPELHYFNGMYYIFATFEQPNGNRGTYSLRCSEPDGEFELNSAEALTPPDWYSLDGTLYTDRSGSPFLVFCHEHVQIGNGTICYVKLNKALDKAIGEPQYMFSGSDAYGSVENKEGRYITDGPFMYRGKNDSLYMIWSSFINSSYYQCVALSDNGEINGKWIQLKPIFTENGGHGMIFKDNRQRLLLTLHCPNTQLMERPVFFELAETKQGLIIQ